MNQVTTNTRSPRFTFYEILRVYLMNQAPAVLKKVACPLFLNEGG